MQFCKLPAGGLVCWFGVCGPWAAGQAACAGGAGGEGGGVGGHSTAYSGTGASTLVGPPSTKWMTFLGHLATQVPQPLHLV